MATPNLKPQSATRQGKIKIVSVGKTVNWPKGERIPKSFGEAVKLGWHVTGSEGKADARTTIEDDAEFGLATMEKRVHGHLLSLTIPCWTSFVYGNPVSLKARKLTHRRVDSNSIHPSPAGAAA